MGHATSNANDVGGHCRLPRKYIWYKVRTKKNEGKRKITTAYER